jgi:ADP-ribose pyrophosphatase
MRRGRGAAGMSGAWTVLDRTEILTAAPYVTVARERVRIASGAVIEDFYQVELATFALCVPQLPSGEIVTFWEYKHGARRFGLGFPAGFVEAGEAADAAGARELTEETGFRAGALDTLGSYVDNGNQRGSLGHYFLARDCVRVADPIVDEREVAEIRLMRPDAVDRALAEGQFAVIHHVAAWALARPRLI